MAEAPVQATQIELIILIGLQASGKSTFYRRYFSQTHQIVSKDLMGNAKKKTARQERLLREAFTSRQSVVLDNTNPALEDRKQAIEIGKAHHARTIAYYFPPDIEANLERNRARTGRAQVPDVAIFDTAKKLCPPSLEEGFDEIWIVHLENPDGFVLVQVSGSSAGSRKN
jgi:predicted kinase